MKKYTWLMALVVALALVFTFVACDDGSGKTKPPVTNLPDVVVEGEAIVLQVINNNADVIIDKNTFALDGKTSPTNHAFFYEFPAEVQGKGYLAINVEMAIVELTSPDFISFNAKADKTIAQDVNIISKVTGKQIVGSYKNELKIAELEEDEDGELLEYVAGSCKVGAKNDESYPMKAFTGGFIAFQYNPWAGDITGKPAAADVTATFKIAVTKITFIGTGEDATTTEPPLEAGDEFFYDLAGWSAGDDYTVDFSKVTLGDEIELITAGTPSAGVISKSGKLDGTTSTVVAFKLIYPKGFDINTYKFISVSSTAVDSSGNDIAAAGSLGTAKLIKDATNKWSTALVGNIYNLGTTWGDGDNPINHPIDIDELPQAFQFGAGSATVAQFKITKIVFHVAKKD